MRFLMTLALVLSVSGVHAVRADDTSNPIDNFHEVSPGVYRGAAPGQDGINYLKSLNVKSDIDLEGTRFWAIIPEEHAADSASIHFIHKPILALPDILGDLTSVNDAEVTEILSDMGDPAQQPVFVHCQKGEDRTGMIVGLFEVLYLHMAPKDAWADMLAHGYHPHFTALTKYFEQKTGFTPPDSD